MLIHLCMLHTLTCTWGSKLWEGPGSPTGVLREPHAACNLGTYGPMEAAVVLSHASSFSVVVLCCKYFKFSLQRLPSISTTHICCGQPLPLTQRMSHPTPFSPCPLLSVCDHCAQYQRAECPPSVFTYTSHLLPP